MELNEEDYRKDYQDLASMIDTFLEKRHISNPPRDVIEMLTFMSGRRLTRGEFKNMHIHPALLNEKNRCLLRVFAYQELWNARVKVPNNRVCWCDHVPLELYPVLYYRSRRPRPHHAVPYQGGAYNDSFRSLVKFCRNACVHMETTRLSYMELDRLLNRIDDSNFALWFNYISEVGFQLSWLPK